MEGRLALVKIEQIELDKGFFEPLSEEDYQKLKASILEIGLIYPVILKKVSDDKFIVVDGRNRITVLQELGAKEIPAFILETQNNLDLLTQIDLELCRRHIEEEKRKNMYEQLRNETYKQIKQNLRKKIIETLKIKDDEVDVILEKLSKMTTKELYDYHLAIAKASDVSRFMHMIVKNTAKTIASESAIPEEVKKALELQYTKEIETLKETLSRREEKLVELEEKILALEQEKRKIEKEQEEFIKKQKEVLEKAIKIKEQEYLKRVEELEAELQKIRAKQGDPEEIKKMLQDLKKMHEEEVRKIIEEKEKEIAEWRNESDKLRREILKSKEELEKIKEEKKESEKKLSYLIAEKNRLTMTINEYENKLKDLVSEKALLKKIEAFRDIARVVLETLENLESPPSNIDTIEKILEEIETIFLEIKKYVNTLKS